MLEWSTRQYKFTVGIGSLGVAAVTADLWNPTLPVWLAMTIALLPAGLFILADPDILPRRFVLIAQVFASIWYILTSCILSAGMAVAPRLPHGWPVYLLAGLCGFVPCVLVLAKTFNGPIDQK